LVVDRDNVSFPFDGVFVRDQNFVNWVFPQSTRPWSVQPRKHINRLIILKAFQTSLLSHGPGKLLLG
jgi:hypothetical protein